MRKVLLFIALLVTAFPTVVVGQTANTPPPTFRQTAHPPAPEAEAYARTIVRKVKPHLAWQEQSSGAASVKLAANIDDTGAVLSVDILQSSGNDAWDRACVEAVRQASPLPLPPGMSPNNRITMTFLPKHGW
ncbi:energy transducer TonB [Burkholderia contaminans]|uniref:energy transducer TonB n=1 Tax=Burkholderia contaminans TaxID=488447 RepID=UPI003113933C